MAITIYSQITFHDVQEHLLDVMTAGDASPRTRRIAVRAILDAYSELVSRRDWKCYYRPYTFYTVASQTSSTITYDHTGGAYERMVTIASGTWPTNANLYKLIISGVSYEVEAYKSSTIITLTERGNPGADVAAGTSYTLARDTYPLPANFKKLDYLYDVNAPGRLIRAEPADVHREQRLVRGTALPTMYCVQQNPDLAGGLAITFAPIPGSARGYSGMGQFPPVAELKVLDYSGIGTVATTADSTTLTGTSTTFTTDHEGCVIRVSPSSDVQIPTSIIGEVVGNRLRPYALQRVIQTRSSATSLVLEQAADATLSGSGYRVSSRIDIEAGAMRNAFLRLCEARFTTNDRKDKAERLAEYNRAYELACWADMRSDPSPGPGFSPQTLADVAGSIDLTPE